MNTMMDWFEVISQDSFVHACEYAIHHNLETNLFFGGFWLMALVNTRTLHPSNSQPRFIQNHPALQQRGEAAVRNLFTAGCRENRTSTTVRLIPAVFAEFPWGEPALTSTWVFCTQVTGSIIDSWCHRCNKVGGSSRGGSYSRRNSKVEGGEWRSL